MVRAYNGEYINDDQTGQIIGISLGGDYFYEHEEPIHPLRFAFGVEENALGINRFKAKTFPEPLVMTGTVDKKPAMLLYFTVNESTMRRFRQMVEAHTSCRNVAGEMGLLGGMPNDAFTAAWDKYSFGILTRGKENVAKLKAVLQMWEDKDLCILHGRHGPFGKGGLTLVRESAFSKEQKAEMLARDEDARQLHAAAEKTGIAKKLKKAGLGWYALKPAWRDFFKNPVYRSRYKVIFFLNPEGQDKYNSGWFTVEELLQWIKGKGPVMRNC